MIKAVLDTNVIISAFLSPTGKPAAILQLVLRGEIRIYFNTAILAEYEQVLGRSKFSEKIRQSAVRRFFEIINDIGDNIISTPSDVCFSDEADRKFYDTAKTCGACLVTGNAKHYPVEPFILSPARFLEEFLA
ncbi:MAG: putative toxin-antitoxin system toxin component, PIN family [Clostridiales bacterium]|jgi:putative PIN family toxin of toxin-antitoxin system|nr:putative toxin-antitoxin system toxin component, PIN family [Clostridiales bacterium]